MSVDKIISYKSIDNVLLENVGFAKPKFGKNGTKYVYFTYPNSENWLIQTPKMRVPFEPYDTSFCVSVGEKFGKCIKTLEEFLIHKASEKSTDWFCNYKSVEDVRSIYVSMLNSFNSDFPPFLKINFKDNYEVYDSEENLVDKTHIKKRTYGTYIIKLSKIFIKVDEHGHTMKCFLDIEQVHIHKEKEETPKNSAMGEYSFLD